MEIERIEMNNECEMLGNVYNNDKFTGGNFGGNIWNTEKNAPTLKTGASALTTVQKDNLVLIKQATKDGYIPCEIGGW